MPETVEGRNIASLWDTNNKSAASQMLTLPML